MQMSELTREYPRSIKGRSGSPVRLHRLSADDHDRLLEFARGLDDEDLLFLRVDLTDPKAVDGIIDSQTDDRRVTLLAESDGEVVGYGSLNRQDLDWMRHLGEIRIIVGGRQRGEGLGSLLVQELFAVGQDLGLTKIVARMVREQNGARRMFERLGFAAEALLTDWVTDRSGKTRDLVIMSYDVTSLTN